MLIFGHSTSYKIVNNPAYKAFVGLKNLKAGDLIYVYSEKTIYTYKVLSVDMKEADQVIVNFNTKERMLTLSTCNTSIGDKSARYIVQAIYVSEKPVQSQTN